MFTYVALTSAPSCCFSRAVILGLIYFKTGDRFEKQEIEEAGTLSQDARNNIIKYACFCTPPDRYAFIHLYV